MQRVQADEDGIAGEQKALVAAVIRSLPGELHNVYQDEPSGAVASRGVVRQRLRGEAHL